MTTTLIINNLPSDGGSPITDIEYRVNEGSAISLGETTIGNYPIEAGLGDDVQIRAVNVAGPGPWSDVKTVDSGETFTVENNAVIWEFEYAE